MIKLFKDCKINFILEALMGVKFQCHKNPESLMIHAILQGLKVTVETLHEEALKKAEEEQVCTILNLSTLNHSYIDEYMYLYLM